ncbi:response regulator containing a CheY-like receiver domain and an HTH DNA-binding domain [Burkholderiales bacterium JOSHI_001]|nr:response regulator containing a CheY-like receiver domain and an HTH DNA-binding domain [Burkholderiales bacterium JOSHI_001]
MPRYKKILLVDDHGLVREGAALHLRALDPEIEVYHARTVEEGKAQLAAHRPDLVFLDLRFDGDPLEGLQLLKWIKSSPEHDATPVIVMSGEPLDRKAIEDLLGDNAAGFLSKGKADSAEIFRVAMMSMEAGAVFIHGARAGAGRATAQAADAPPPAPRSAASLGLNESHRRVLMLHVRGTPYKRIARECNLAEVTVKEYISDMCRLFKVENAKALIYEIARAGVVLREDA